MSQIENLDLRTRTGVQRRHPRRQKHRTYMIGAMNSESLYLPRRRCRVKILNRLPVLRRDLVLPVEKKASHPQTFPRESSFRTHRSRFLRAAVQIEAYKYGGSDSQRRRNDFNLKVRKIARRMEAIRTLLHRPLPSLSRLTLTANDWRARLLTAELPCTIPLPLCERWRLACACLIATPTVPLLLPLNQSKLLSFQLWFARLHANPKATPMASPAV